MMTILLVVIFITFIGVGLPDSVLGTAWPAMYRDFDLPISLAGYLSMTISLGTIFSSLVSSKLINRFGTGVVTAFSTVMTAAALFGFAATKDVVFLFALSIPLGLGGGTVDTALNNFVALHYSASQMNYLHCFYGIGVAVSPYLMSVALSADNDWRRGYISVALIQSLIALITIASLPLWKKVGKRDEEENTPARVLSFSQLMKMRAVRTGCLVYFASCAVELTAGSWSSTFFVNSKGFDADKAAQVTMLFYIGLALGRFLSGVMAKWLDLWRLIWIASGVMGLSIVLLLLPLPTAFAIVALFLMGLGIGPIFPNLTHLTPQLFGKDISQSVIGVQFAACYVGVMVMPWLFGVLAQQFTTGIFGGYLMTMFLVYIIAFFVLVKCFDHTGKVEENA